MTSRKPDMRTHFQKVLKVCPGAVNDIELTDEIKEHVMNNRVFHVPLAVDPTKITNHVINNYNTMNNFVANLDCVEKIMCLASYKQLELMDFETKVEEEYQRNVKRLEKDSFKHGFTLRHQDFMQIIDTLTKAIRGDKRDEFIEQLSFIYDSKRKRIRVYNSSEKWEEVLVTTGLTYLVNTIAGSYLESYEIYLIRKIQSPRTVTEPALLHKCIEDYYKFLACFDVDPYVKGKYDNMVIYNRDSDEFSQEPEDGDVEAHQIVDRYSKLYFKIYDDLTNAQKKAVHKEVLDIIKSNTENSVAEIDKDIIGLINIDEGFKSELMGLNPQVSQLHDAAVAR
jgi:hypothetical protein